MDSEPLRLNCYVFGDDPRCVFPVEIAPTKTVGALKKLIKEENKHSFPNIDAKLLVLWEVSISLDANFKKTLNNLELADGESLSPTQELCEYFSEGAMKNHVHIVIKVPAGELEPRWPPQ